MSLPDTPNTLREKYYSVMAGQNDADILPDIETSPSTENRYLDYLARNGGGGGGDVTKAYVDEQDAKKADKVTSATAGNFAGLDSNGNLTDSGKKAADFATADDMTDVQSVIPSTATTSNKLATASDVTGEDISATSTTSPLTDSADGMAQKLTVYGASEVTEDGIKSVWDAGGTVTTSNSDNTSTTSATFNHTLRGIDDLRDELTVGQSGGQVITRCYYDSEADEVKALAEPIITPLTSAEVAAFRSLRTYDSTTHITITDEPEYSVDYLKNTDNGQTVADIQTDLQGQIDEVKNATKPRVYAFYVDQNDSNPATCVHPYYNTKYGCDNLFYQNAYMDYSKDEFNYGSWEEFVKEFFKPVMLAYDGHVDYYLDPDDYETKLDGGTSDIKDMSYNGNVMVQIKKLWFKRWTAGGKYYCIISDKKLDKSFKAFAHHDIKGNVLEYIYRAAYDGSYDGTRLRSISGIDYHNANALTVNKIMSNTTRQQEINFAKANNDGGEKGEGWNILHKAEWDLINDLLLLIGMSTNTQATFGNGNISSYVSTTNTGIIATGTMDKKGLFYGKNDNVSGVKVFGIEMPWGNIWKSCFGWILSANQYLVKMTHGTEDGSTATDYNLDGTGYVATGKTITSNGYISAFDGADTGFLPTATSGSVTTYMCDYVWQDTATYFAFVAGGSGVDAQCGAFSAILYSSTTGASWRVGAVLSYKGLAAQATVG